jgi:hypothetical protein
MSSMVERGDHEPDAPQRPVIAKGGGRRILVLLFLGTAWLFYAVLVTPDQAGANTELPEPLTGSFLGPSVEGEHHEYGTASNGRRLSAVIAVCLAASIAWAAFEVVTWDGRRTPLGERVYVWTNSALLVWVVVLLALGEGLSAVPALLSVTALYQARSWHQAKLRHQNRPEPHP